MAQLMREVQLRTNASLRRSAISHARNILESDISRSTRAWGVRVLEGEGEEVARFFEAELSSQISRESVKASWLDLVHFPPTEGDTPGQEHPPSRTSPAQHER
jgi:hypothetical protein